MTPSEAIQALLDEACQRAGLSDFGEPVYVESLSRWVRSIDHPRVGEFGRQFLHRQMVRELVRRLRVVDFLGKHPEVLEVELPPIIFITGMARTGTTLLHNLMGLHPGARTLRRWELTEPLPPPDSTTRATDPRIAKVRKRMEPLLGTTLEHMHWVDADDPEECVFGFHDCTGVMGRSLTTILPEWSRPFYESDDWAAASFREYRKMLQLLTWKSPAPRGGHLLLKCPQTLVGVERFVAEFPEAKVVFTHRDPYRAIVSATFLLGDINTAFLAEGHDPGLDFDQTVPVPPIVARCCATMERFAQAHPQRLANVRYADLMQDAIATLEDTYAALGMPAGPDLPSQVRGFLARQRSGGRKKPSAISSSYGLDHDALLAGLEGYCARFGVSKEGQRVTDTRTE